jgi:hypothetical protein
METINLNPDPAPVPNVVPAPAPAPVVKNTKGRTIVFVVLIVVVLFILGGVAYYFMNRDKKIEIMELPIGPSPGPSPGPPSYVGPTPDTTPTDIPDEYENINLEALDANPGETILVTEEGSIYKQNESGSTTENYMAFPMNIPTSVSENFVYAYNPNDTAVNASTLTGSNQTWVNQTNKCPDYTYNCLFYERVEDGRVKKITNNEGVDLLEQFTNDLYDGKLSVYTENKKQITDMYELDEEGRLYVKRPDLPGGKFLVKPGENSAPGMFFLALILAYWATGKPKPNIVIDLPNKTRAEIMTNIENFNKSLKTTSTDVPNEALSDIRDRVVFASPST